MFGLPVINYYRQASPPLGAELPLKNIKAITSGGKQSRTQMAAFSSAKEKQAKLFNGDNEEDKSRCSFGDRKAGGVLRWRQQRAQVAFSLSS